MVDIYDRMDLILDHWSSSSKSSKRKSRFFFFPDSSSASKSSMFMILGFCPYGNSLSAGRF